MIDIDDGTVLRSATLPGETIASSPGGDQLVIGSEDGKLFLWDVVESAVVREFHTTGRFRKRNNAHPDAINDVTVSASGSLAASCSGRLTENQGTGGTGLMRGVIGGVAGIATALISGDVEWALEGFGGSQDSANQARLNEVKRTTQASVWNLETGHEVFQAGWDDGGHTDGVSCVAFHPNEQSLITGSFDGILRSWDLKSHDCVASRNMYSGPITAMAFVSDGSGVLYSTFESHRIWKWSPG